MRIICSFLGLCSTCLFRVSVSLRINACFASAVFVSCFVSVLLAASLVSVLLAVSFFSVLLLICLFLSSLFNFSFAFLFCSASNFRLLCLFCFAFHLFFFSLFRFSLTLSRLFYIDLFLAYFISVFSSFLPSFLFVFLLVASFRFWCVLTQCGHTEKIRRQVCRLLRALPRSFIKLWRSTSSMPLPFKASSPTSRVHKSVFLRTLVQIHSVRWDMCTTGHWLSKPDLAEETMYPRCERTINFVPSFLWSFDRVMTT